MTTKAEKAGRALDSANFGNMHKDITEERVLDAVERRMTTLANPGFCLACGVEAGGCEPDARRYRCESCGADAVYGADEVLIHFEQSF